MIVYVDGRETPQCDACGERFRPVEPPRDGADVAVREAARAQGWLERLNERATGRAWEHACPACQREPDPRELTIEARVAES